MKFVTSLIMGLLIMQTSNAAEQNMHFDCESPGIKAAAFINFLSGDNITDGIGATFMLPSGKTAIRYNIHHTNSFLNINGTTVRQFIGQYGGVVVDYATVSELRSFMDGVFYDPRAEKPGYFREYLISIRITENENNKTAKFYLTSMVLPKSFSLMTREQRYFYDYGSNKTEFRNSNPDYIVRNAQIVMDCVANKTRR